AILSSIAKWIAVIDAASSTTSRRSKCALTKRLALSSPPTDARPAEATGVRAARLRTEAKGGWRRRSLHRTDERPPPRATPPRTRHPDRHPDRNGLAPAAPAAPAAPLGASAAREVRRRGETIPEPRLLLRRHRVAVLGSRIAPFADVARVPADRVDQL